MAKWISKLNGVLGKRSDGELKDMERAMLAPAEAEAARARKSGEAELQDRQELRQLLVQYAPEEHEEIDRDLSSLINLTKEVKAINNQAAMLHGERIKKAQTILKSYREGAFTAWLKATYGNRQTPYNLLQYYEFVMALPKELRGRVEEMPRQAIYTLASRSGAREKKLEIVEAYNGETKNELLGRIRDTFPLPTTDKRRQDVAVGSAQMLRKIHVQLSKKQLEMTEGQKEQLYTWLDQIRSTIETAPVAEA